MKKIYFTLFIGFISLSNAYSNKNNINTDKLTNENLKEIVVLRDKCDIIYENVYKDVYDHGGTDQEAKAIAAAARCACKEVLTQAPK